VREREKGESGVEARGRNGRTAALRQSGGGGKKGGDNGKNGRVIRGIMHLATFGSGKIAVRPGRQ